MDRGVILVEPEIRGLTNTSASFKEGSQLKRLNASRDIADIAKVNSSISI